MKDEETKKKTEKRCKCSHLPGQHDGVDGHCRSRVWGMPEGCDCERYREYEPNDVKS
jgi:hypothetical protein